MEDLNWIYGSSETVTEVDDIFWGHLYPTDTADGPIILN
jgi:hypothetical protein